LELVVVLLILGVLGAVAVSRFGPNSITNLGAEADARKLALDLLQAQRRAMVTGDNHYLLFTSGGGSVTGYTIYRRGTPDVAVDSARQFDSRLAVTASHTTTEYDFSGAALASYQFTLTAPDRTWTVSVVAATGSVSVSEN